MATALDSSSVSIGLLVILSSAILSSAYNTVQWVLLQRSMVVCLAKRHVFLLPFEKGAILKTRFLTRLVRIPQIPKPLWVSQNARI